MNGSRVSIVRVLHVSPFHSGVNELKLSAQLPRGGWLEHLLQLLGLRYFNEV